MCPLPPGAPRVSDIFQTSCKLAWTPPTSDGGTPVLGYHVERRTGTSPRWVRVNIGLVHDTHFNVSDLVENNKYEFRIVAENKAGQSPASDPTPPVLAKDPWGKPGQPGKPRTSDITKRSCKLSWTSPSDDGGDPIRSYIIEYKAVGSFKWIRANDGEKTLETSYKISGLHADFEYEFRVAAENRGGCGPYSDTTLPVRTEDKEEAGNAPGIRSHLSDTVANSGKTVTLEVDIRPGKPKAEIRWYKDNRELYKSSKTRMAYSDNEQTATLTIFNVEANDSGKYKCEASNRHGRVDSKAILTVNGMINYLFTSIIN